MHRDTKEGQCALGRRLLHPNCFGVPLYREYQTGSEQKAGTPPPFIRMAGMALCQRETMAPNHGHYFLDTSVSAQKQSSWPANPTDQRSVNVFREGQVYDFFHVFATKDTEQTIHLYVGPNLNNQDVLNSVNFIRVQIEGFPFAISRPTPPAGNPGDPPILTPTYDPTTGVLTVVVNQARLANDYVTAGASKCQPASMCTWNGSKCTGVTNAFPELTQAEREATCSHAGEDIDCPTGGCVGFSFKMPAFTATDQVVNQKLTTNAKYAMCFPKDANWNIFPLTPLDPKLVGACRGQTAAPMAADFGSCP